MTSSNTAIAAIQCFKVRLPFNHGAPAPLFAGKSRTTLDSIWMRVELGNGMVGWGEAYAADLDAVCALVRHRVEPLALGKDATDRQLTSSLERMLHNLGRSGPVLHALSGLDIALWDLRGKLEGVPLYELLGGAKRTRIAAYASLLQYYGNREHLETNVGKAIDAGFTQVKLHERTAEAVAIARAAMPRGMPLMVDTNCAWTTANALAEVRAMATSDPFWIEEPIWPPEDLDGMKQLRKDSQIPVAAGENASNLLELTRMVTEQAVDWVQPSAIKCGGVTALQRVAEACANHPGVRFSPQTAFFGPGFLATLHVLAAAEQDTIIERLFCDLAFTPYRDTIPLVNGTFTLASAAGLGAEPDVEILAASEQA
ncbi:mandelate racemase [Rhodoferax koreense]|uniref:Mandelate racemase n=1 Tax=Rhodoferax koreensis TaxID=1842727 RepID=A0A1P8K0Q9_9BURK|nr:mandelate racemase/muconate lactonizing enzyme family protein [Rhodoferax koreense]APW39531.1 mandelate racemase [Rhodoferax koreense]